MGRAGADEVEITVVDAVGAPDIATHAFFSSRPGPQQAITRTFASQSREYAALENEEIEKECRQVETTGYRMSCRARICASSFTLFTGVAAVVAIVCGIVILSNFLLLFTFILLLGVLFLVLGLLCCALALRSFLRTPRTGQSQAEIARKVQEIRSRPRSGLTTDQSEYLAFTPEALLVGVSDEQSGEGWVTAIPFEHVRSVEAHASLGGRVKRVDVTWFQSRGGTSSTVVSPAEPEDFMQAIRQEQERRVLPGNQ